MTLFIAFLVLIGISLLLYNNLLISSFASFIVLILPTSILALNLPNFVVVDVLNSSFSSSYLSTKKSRPSIYNSCTRKKISFFWAKNKILYFICHIISININPSFTSEFLNILTSFV